MDNRKLLKKSDLLVVFCVIAAAAVFMLFNRRAAPDELACLVLYDGAPVKAAALGEDGIFHIPEAPLMEFEISGGKIAVIYSDCPDKVCVRTGFISHAGQKIVCLPNKVVVSVDHTGLGSYNPDAPDMIAQ